MDKIPWLDVIKSLIPNLGSVKGFSKALAKAIFTFVIRVSGPLSWIGSLLLEKGIKWGILEAKDVIQKIKDDKTISIGDQLEKELPTDEVKRKRKENLKKLLEG